MAGEREGKWEEEREKEKESDRGEHRGVRRIAAERFSASSPTPREGIEASRYARANFGRFRDRRSGGIPAGPVAAAPSRGAYVRASCARPGGNQSLV